MKLSKLESKYHCHCGHLESRHGCLSGKSVCWECYEECFNITARLNAVIDSVHQYEPDNLSYLEERLREKETIDKNRPDQTA